MVGFMLRTAVLFDGRFFLKHYLSQRAKYNPSVDPVLCADHIFEMALREVHLESNSKARKIAGRSTSDQKSASYQDIEVRDERYLYRIFYYDCPPYAGKQHYPISGKAVDYSKTPVAGFTYALHQALKKKRKVALRLGTILADSWRFKAAATSELLKKKKTLDEITDDDVELSMRQKGIDMKIGIDIASLAFKKQVEQIILVAGDADFVPAAKLARREGVDFVLHTMGNNISDSLYEHIDGLRTEYYFGTKNKD